jgi:hypothetical protein
MPEDTKETIPWSERKGPSIFLIILAVIGSVIGSGVVQSVLTYQTQKSEQINLAKGYLMDIDYINRTINGYLEIYNTPGSPWYHIPPAYYARPFYPDWGLYYSNRQDISKFDPDLSKSMYDFYYKILTAEDDRKQYNDYETLHPLNPNYPLDPQRENISLAKSVFNQEIWAVIDDVHTYTIPNLKTELNRIINS